MYAVIETGGKQYRVELGSELHVELTGATPGSEISFDRVLLVRTDSTTEIGTPVVAGAKVTATVLGQERGPKTISFKYRPKARSRITKGHRQELHLIKVTEVTLILFLWVLEGLHCFVVEVHAELDSFVQHVLWIV